MRFLGRFGADLDGNCLGSRDFCEGFFVVPEERSERE